jgi:hypothetical protein
MSEKIQEVENYLKYLTKDIDDYYDKIISLTKTFIDDLGKMFDTDTKDIYIDNYFGDIVFRHRSNGNIIGDVMISNYLLHGFQFRSMNLVVNHYIDSNLQNNMYYFSFNQMIYEAVKNQSDVFLTYQNNVNGHLASVLSKKQLSKTLEWVYNLLNEVDKETKQDEIFYKGYYFSEISKKVKSFDYEEIYVNGLSFSKNATGTYSIQLLNNDKTIKSQSTRANEEVLMNLIKSFV